MNFFANHNAHQDDWSVLRPDMGSEDIWNVQELYSDDSIQAMILEMSVFFNATHFITSQSGVQGILHRHSFQFSVTAQYKRNSDGQFFVPFEDFKNVLNDISRFYEGKLLNELPVFREKQSTTENFVKVLAYQLERLIKELPLEINELSLHESPTVGVKLIIRHE